MVDSDPEGAVKVLERSVEAFPADTDDIHLQYAYFSLGKALRLSGRPEDAIPVLELRLKNPDQRETVQRELDAAREAAAG
jgi:ABC-type lipoprotein release transport system permease subunit